MIFSDKKIIFFLLCLGCITISFNVAAIAAAIPEISTDLRLPALAVARIIPFYMIPYGIAALFYAPLTTRLSYRRTLGISFVLYAAASFLCGQARTLDIFLVGRLCMGVAGASAIPLGLMIIGQLFETQVRGRLVGLFFTTSFVASLAGIALSGVAHWRWLFYVPALLGLTTALGVLLYPSILLGHVHSRYMSYASAFGIKKIRWVFAFIMAISFLYHGVHNWFGVYLDKIYHLDKLHISLFFMMMAISGGAGQMAGGYLSDKRGRLAACYIGVFLLAGMTLLLSWAFPLKMLAVILCLFAAGWTVGHNGASTILTDFPQEQRPVIASLNSALRFSAGGVGFFVSSLFVGKGFGVTFFAFGLLMPLSVVLLRRVAKVI